MLIGSLSQVIGFLPEDKELHEQMLASRSSSSIDLDEDTSKQQAEQDSLNFQCQHVLQEAFDDHDDLSFELCLAKKRLQIQGESFKQLAFYPICLQQPKQPSTQERELHNMTHIPSQPWCVVSRSKRQSFTAQAARTSDQRLPALQLLCLHQTASRQRANNYLTLG